MHARSALFDVYGDHLHTRGHQAPVAALIRLLAPIGVAPPAVRTAVSRMVAQGWLEPVTLPAGRGYRATPRAVHRLEAAATRVYQRNRPWDGCWHLALVDGPHDRAARLRLRAALQWLGYARLGEDLWVSPYPRDELPGLLESAGAGSTTWVGSRFEPPDQPLGAWDLAALRASYDAWLAGAGTPAPYPPTGHGDADEAAFAARFHLVHEWRKFLFRDPGLPDALLPDDWPGRTARERFTREAAALKEASDRFVSRCLAGS